MNNLNRVLNLKYPEVLGIGLGGAELLGPAKDYEEVFQKAEKRVYTLLSTLAKMMVPGLSGILLIISKSSV
jgi:hypothetical protein